MNSRLTQWLLRLLLAGLSRLASAWHVPLRPSTAPNATEPGTNPSPLNLPPFTGGPEEAAVLKPKYLAKQRRVVPITDGVIPESTEEIKLTNDGKAIARTGFLVMDGNGFIAPADKLPKGRCSACQRFVFDGDACASCGRFFCAADTVTVDDAAGALKLCADCERRRRWERLNW